MYHEIDEPQLIADAKAGDQTAQLALLGRYEALLRSVAIPLVGFAETEDVLQDVRLKVIQKLSMFREKPGAKFKDWIAEIARNASFDRLRRSGRAPVLELNEAEEFAGDRSAFVRSADVTAEFDECVRALTAFERRVIHLLFNHDLTIGRTAKALGCSYHAVRCVQEKFRAMVRDNITGANFTRKRAKAARTKAKGARAG